MLTLRAIVRLIRLDTSLLGFVAVFLPLFVRTHDFHFSCAQAVPLLFICISTFIANDLDDLERDCVNHPDRPLPRGQIPSAFAVVLFFAFLILALFSTRHYVSPGIAFWYYALFTFAISYGYIVEWLPSLKAPYVALMSSVPVLVVAAWYPNERRFYSLAGAMFLLTAGREVCMDIRDRPGDRTSSLQRLDPAFLAIVGLFFQAAGLLVLATQVRKAEELIDLVIMTVVLATTTLSWFTFKRQRPAVILMKTQFLLGLYFLT